MRDQIGSRTVISVPAFGNELADRQQIYVGSGFWGIDVLTPKKLAS